MARRYTRTKQGHRKDSLKRLSNASYSTHHWPLLGSWCDINPKSSETHDLSFFAYRGSTPSVTLSPSESILRIQCVLSLYRSRSWTTYGHYHPPGWTAPDSAVPPTYPLFLSTASNARSLVYFSAPRASRSSEPTTCTFASPPHR